METQYNTSTSNNAISPKKLDHHNQLPKRHIKDLSKEWDLISELNNRIDNLHEGVNLIKSNVKEQQLFVQETCDKLKDQFANLQRSSQISGVIKNFNLLNELCDRYQILQEDESKNNNIQAKVDLLDAFEGIYSPMEPILSRRNDLPYHNVYLSLKKSTKQQNHNLP